MAQRRMFNLQVIDSDAFIGMPATTQNLYFHLCMRADDDGFISGPKKIQRMIGASDDDMQILLAKRFILAFESGVIVIKHWRLHNYIPKDRYHETLYKEERATLFEKPNGVYTDHPTIEQDGETLYLPRPANRMEAKCIQAVYNESTEDRLEEDSESEINSGDTVVSPCADEKAISEQIDYSADIQKVINEWNLLNLRRVTKLVPGTERYTMLKKRIKDYGVDNVLKAIWNVKTSQFLNGNNKRGFVATFDWFIKPSNFPKVLDGNYNDTDKEETVDEKAYKGATWLAACIKDRVPDFCEPTPQELDKWARDFDAIHRMGYTWKQISNTAVFALNDPFWCPLIISGEELRKNFVKILSKGAQ